MTAPTLTQLRLARGDSGLTARIVLAADRQGYAAEHAHAALTRILAADADDTSLAVAYEYHWTVAVQQLATAPADRDVLAARLARVGTDPAAISDQLIEAAVAAVLGDGAPLD